MSEVALHASYACPVELNLMLKSLAVEVLQPVPHLSHTNCNSLTNSSKYISNSEGEIDGFVGGLLTGA